MTSSAGEGLDPQGAAREVLNRAVSDYGVAVLSNATIMEGICGDRLTDWPREASLLTVAAQADVAGMLRQQSGVGADSSVRLTASTLAESRMLDPAACIWVVSEYARALGFEVSQNLTTSEPQTAPPTVPPAQAAPLVAPFPQQVPMTPAGAGIADTGEETRMPGAMPTAAGAGPMGVPGGMPQPGSPMGQVPGGPMPGGPMQGGVMPGGPMQGGVMPGGPMQGGAMPGGPMPGGPMPGGPMPGGPMPGGMVPPAGPMGPMGPMPGGPMPGGPSGGSGMSKGARMAVGIVTAVVVYLIIAAVGHIAPFTKSPPKKSATTTTHTTTTPTTTHTTTTPTTTTTKTTTTKTINALVPSSITSSYTCTTDSNTAPSGAVGSLTCKAKQTGQNPAIIDFFQFAGSSTITTQWQTVETSSGYTKATSHPTCNTTTFVSGCEAGWTISGTQKGQILEWTLSGVPELYISIVPTREIILMGSKTGNGLITFLGCAGNFSTTSGAGSCS